MNLILNRNSTILSNIMLIPVKRAIINLERDIKKACLPSDENGCKILLAKKQMQPEEFLLVTEQENNRLCLYAQDELGFAYGLYEISRSILGITDFWFWMDQPIKPQKSFVITGDYRYQSLPYKVKLRGWFVNDEVLIDCWSVNGRSEEAWEMVFEALLRCGGNMVIPGTDKNTLRYRSLAAEMGLYITHHHAEPLGAEMFARAYPELTASYDLHPDKFKELWQAGIEAQGNYKMVWNLGFRGQGDRPFWEDDPRYQTPKERGRLMSQLIQIQYDMVKDRFPEAYCCTNLYGETMELYKDGYLSLPENVIKIWADNGFGKMVSRRQMNHNPRVRALPPENDHSKHGIYYHVSFYDLQAANHITMLPNSPEFVADVLGQVFDQGMDEYWVINCSNVKPHVYFLSVIAQIWRMGTIDVSAHRKTYITTYYGSDQVGLIEKSLEDYPRYAVAYGENEDEHAGEQFINHVPRMLISQFLIDSRKRQEELVWAADVPDLMGQVQWFMEKCKIGVENYTKYLSVCETVEVNLGKAARCLFQDTIKLQVQIYYHCFKGAMLTCESILAANNGQYQNGFYLAGCAREEYLAGNMAMRMREHGKWQDYYANECLTDIKQSAWVLESLMSYLRNLGDGPHFYKWQQEFLYSQEDRRVMLILNMQNHLKDRELFNRMKARLDSDGTCLFSCYRERF